MKTLRIGLVGLHNHYHAIPFADELQKGIEGRVGVGLDYAALPGLMLVDVWKWTPFVILVLHAGMLGISPQGDGRDGNEHHKVLGLLVVDESPTGGVRLFRSRPADGHRSRSGPQGSDQRHPRGRALLVEAAGARVALS
ncbi:MAG TPA: hypothetical protein VG757_05150 [Devosia sp.]|nr:hypothetical protein [Devosia sp.]